MALTAFVCLTAAAPARPAPAAAPERGAAAADHVPPGYDPETGHRSYSQHAFTKIRQGSMLHSEVPDAPLALPELRGALGLRRDAELIKHFSRLAQLDLIAGLANESNDVTLGERAEEVRRKETQRFNDAMQELRQQVWRQCVAETP